MIDLTLLPRTVLWCFVSSKPSSRVKVRKAVTFASSSSSRGNAAPAPSSKPLVFFSSSSSSSSRGWHGCCLLLGPRRRQKRLVYSSLLLLLLRGRRQSAHHRRHRHHLFRFGLVWWLFWEDKSSSKMFSARVIRDVYDDNFRPCNRLKMYHKTRDDTIQQYDHTERRKAVRKKWRGQREKIVQRNAGNRSSAASFFRRFCNTRSCESRILGIISTGETIIRCGCGTRCFGASRATGAIEAWRNTRDRRETHTRKK